MPSSSFTNNFVYIFWRETIDRFATAAALLNDLEKTSRK